MTRSYSKVPAAPSFMAVLLLAFGAAHAADIGNTGSTSNDTRGFGGGYYAIQITTTEAGTLTSITGRISATGAHRTRAWLTDSSGNILASSTVRTDIGSTLADHTFTGFGSYSLSTTTTYYLVIGSDPGNTANIAYEIGLTYDGYLGGSGTHDVDTPDDPLSLTIDGSARDFAIYATYTPGSSAVPISALQNTSKGIGPHKSQQLGGLLEGSP